MTDTEKTKSPESLSEMSLEQKNEAVDSLLKTIEGENGEGGVLGIVEDIMDNPPQDSEEITDTIKVFLANAKKLDEYIADKDVKKHDDYDSLKDYQRIFSDHAANLAIILSTKGKHKELKAQLDGITGGKGFAELTPEQRKQVTEAAGVYLPANSKNNELRDVSGEYTDENGERIIDKKALIPTLTREIQESFPGFSMELADGLKNGEYKMILKKGNEEIGKLYLPKNPNPQVSPDEVPNGVITPYSHEEHPYLFRIEIGDEERKFLLENGFTDQSGTLPSVVRMIETELEK